MTAAHDHSANEDEEAQELAALENLVGRELLGRYRLDVLLSIGGTGAVYKGHQITLKRDVAVKILHPQLTQNERIFKRFRREAESTARFEHPNIVQVLEAGSTEDGYHFIIMQLLDGVELHERLGAPFVPRHAAELMLQLFCGLEHAHQRGVVHRDLKPENVFITKDHEDRETVKLVDFGLAKLLEGAEDGETLTRLGMVFGTPAYMSPEQATGREVDHRTDLYSAGLIFYGMLAGRPPFIEDDPVALMRAQVKQTPPPLPDEVPTELAELVFALLAKAPEDRPTDATAVRGRLEEIIPRLPDAHGQRRRIIPLWLRVAAVAVVVGGISLTAVALTGEDMGGARVESSASAATVSPASTPTPPDSLASPAPTETVPAAGAQGPTAGSGPDPSQKPSPPPADADETDTDGSPSEATDEASASSSGKPTPKKSSSSSKKKSSSGSKKSSKKTEKKKKGFWQGGFRKPGQG